jgi:hypothetical protein
MQSYNFKSKSPKKLWRLNTKYRNVNPASAQFILIRCLESAKYLQLSQKRHEQKFSVEIISTWFRKYKYRGPIFNQFVNELVPRWERGIWEKHWELAPSWERACSQLVPSLTKNTASDVFREGVVILLCPCCLSFRILGLEDSVYKHLPVWGIDCRVQSKRPTNQTS